MAAFDAFVAEICIFPFGFAPPGWASCDGQLLPISQNTALFSLLGVTYGGDGKSTFGLPNLNGRAPLHPGQGAGLSSYDLGEVGGTATVSLLASEMPAHAHGLHASQFDATTANPATAVPASSEAPLYHSSGEPVQPLVPAGSGLPHNNLQPTLVLGYYIALQGVYPPRP